MAEENTAVVVTEEPQMQVEERGESLHQPPPPVPVAEGPSTAKRPAPTVFFLGASSGTPAAVKKEEANGTTAT